MRANSNPNVSRRGFVKVASLAGILTCGGLVSACSSAGTEPAASTPEPEAQPAEAPSTETEQAANPTAGTEEQAQGTSDALVVVYSWSGNTLAVGERIAQDLGAELFRIEPTTPYTDNYDEMLDIAREEQAAGTLPAIASHVADWDGYKTIYLGFPTWWGHLPQIVRSFGAEHDGSGKVIYPFNTHGGSGFASCLSDLAEVWPDAEIRDGLSLYGDSAATSTDEIDAWVSASR